MSTGTLSKEKERLRQLILTKAYFREKIILSSGKESDYYIDARLVTLFPEGVLLIAQLMLEMIRNDKVDAIGGPTLGADPMVGALGVISHQQGRPLTTFLIRKEAKGHGKKNLVEGPRLSEGSRVVLIDDVATTGKAFLHSLDVMDEMRIKVVKALCIVDRGEGAKDALLKRNCPLESIFQINEIHKV